MLFYYLSYVKRPEFADEYTRTIMRLITEGKLTVTAPGEVQSVR